jgi:hypothetical protein
MCLSPHVVHKGKQETSVGKTHRDIKTKSDHGNHEIREVMDQEPRSPKLDPNRPESGCLASYMGQPAHHSAALPYTSSMVSFEPNTLYFHVSLSVLNWIENPLINNFKTWEKIIIDSHDTFSRSLATIRNLLLGTLCYLSCCGIRYGRIMKTWFLMSCY